MRALGRRERPLHSRSTTPDRYLVAEGSKERCATLLGLKIPGDQTQGSSFLATPGFEAESRWDSHSKRHAIRGDDQEIVNHAARMEIREELEVRQEKDTR